MKGLHVDNTKKEQPILSICMIVGKEESNLKRCLDSLLPLIHEKWCELIILVTQDGDRTMEIAREYTDKVFFQAWQRDFSFHRNYSISHATGKKIMIMDADEELDQRSIYTLQDIILNPKWSQYKTVMPTIRSWLDKDFKDAELMRQPRIFVNDHKPIYTGTAHNKPRATAPYLFAEHVIINHYGYQFDGNEELRQKKNRDRTLPLLLERYEKDPKDIHNLTHVCKTYNALSMYPEFKRHFDEWAGLMIGAKERGEYNDGWVAFLEVFNAMAGVYATEGDLENCIRVKDIAERFSDRLHPVYFALGFVYDMKGDEENAVLYFEKGLQLLDQESKNPYESLISTHTHVVAPQVQARMARYHFKNGRYHLAGTYLNYAIYNNQNLKLFRWDIWNSPDCQHLLKDVKVG